MSSAERSVAASLASVRERIAGAAGKAGREPGEVQLLAVTKTVEIARIREAVEAGQRLFGENRVQEARDKVATLGGGLTWHMIGHLQKNKAKAAAGLFDAVESVDSLELAVLLDRRAGEDGRVLKVFIQIDEAGEATKSGIGPPEAPALIERVCTLPHLDLQGLMTIPPWPDTPEDSRPFFASLRHMREQWDGACCPAGTLRHLSMGMTADFEVAVEEGATIVRVGSAIFGERPYP